MPIRSASGQVLPSLSGTSFPLAPQQMNMNAVWAMRRLQRQQSSLGKQAPPGKIQGPPRPLKLKRY
jgi:hypothetical protein